MCAIRTIKNKFIEIRSHWVSFFVPAAEYYFVFNWVNGLLLARCRKIRVCDVYLIDKVLQYLSTFLSIDCFLNYFKIRFIHDLNCYSFAFVICIIYMELRIFFTWIFSCEVHYLEKVAIIIVFFCVCVSIAPCCVCVGALHMLRGEYVKIYRYVCPG